MCPATRAGQAGEEDQAPDLTWPVSMGHEFLFQWVITSQTPGAVVPLGGALVAVPPRQQTCMISLVASSNKPSPSMSDWIIESSQWNGAC